MSKVQKSNKSFLKIFIFFIVLVVLSIGIYFLLGPASKPENSSIAEGKVQNYEIVQYEENNENQVRTENEPRINEVVSTIEVSPGTISFSLKDLINKPEFSIPDYSGNVQVISHAAYSLSYNENYEQADWVSYTLTRENLINKENMRRDNFKPDPKVKTGSAHPDDYKKSGYDRGHLAPAADFSWSETAMDESFYMSNMSPQVPSFNRGIWKKLEDQVRTWALENQRVFIVTGPILEKDLPTIGKNNVAVPKYYYKVILDIDEPDIKGIAFIMPNSGSNETLAKYSVSIDSIEKLTSINFFPLLPDSIEEKVEKKVDIKLWFK
jgi:endonuclease G, mitochondrial